ncbi:prenyltransferase/squalene oxidase repeat-containing protein [Streptoverticillium reticulum]|uniref:prenyltransferase/squalene oxidase repeat-containing protein n=1 Tax=Streptoverticillium reticulum TaxID=1433415 RepID=UPI0039BF6CA1
MAPSFAVHARRGAVALATAAVLGAAAAPAAFADGSPSPAAPGLYGAKDPKFDGVFRQSLALVAQHAVGVSPAPAAVDWLAGQQCSDGGFAGYRADTGKACDPKAGEFTDATSAAVQGLAAVGGRDGAVQKGLGWLKEHQNEDGGWGMTPGAASDANSTSIAAGAFAAAGQDPAKATGKGGKSPYDALLSFQLGCDKKEDERGAFAYLPQNGELQANDLASTAAALAALGKGFGAGAPDKGDKPVKPLDCAGDDSAKPKDAAAAADAVAGYLAKKLDANGGQLKSSMPGAPEGPDFGATADAVIALAAGGHREAAGKPLAWLQSKDSKTAEWAAGDPGRLAKLILAAHTAGADPRAFGGADLVQQLAATGPKPEAAASEKPSAEEKKDGGSDSTRWWVLGAAFIASVGVGILLSGRMKKNQQ